MNYELDFFATVESLRVPAFLYPKADQSSSHNISSLRPCIHQSVNELSHDLHVRRTAYDHLVLQKPCDELIEWITRPPDGPAALQIPVSL